MDDLYLFNELTDKNKKTIRKELNSFVFILGLISVLAYAVVSAFTVFYKIWSFDGEKAADTILYNLLFNGYVDLYHQTKIVTDSFLDVLDSLKLFLIVARELLVIPVALTGCGLIIMFISRNQESMPSSGFTLSRAYAFIFRIMTYIVLVLSCSVIGAIIILVIKDDRFAVDETWAAIFLGLFIFFIVVYNLIRIFYSKGINNFFKVVQNTASTGEFAGSKMFSYVGIINILLCALTLSGLMLEAAYDGESGLIYIICDSLKMIVLVCWTISVFRLQNRLSRTK